jgi:uracil-DNA glycosylase family 4
MDAKIAIVGMAPGDKEVEAGVPFVGPAGQLLSTCMRQVGINRGDCFLTNVSEVRPPAHKLELLSSVGVSLSTEVGRLHRELQRVKPIVTVVLGNDAMYHTIGKDKIYNWRGSVLPSPFNKGWIIPSLHPAGLVRGDYKHSAYLMFDLHKANRIANTLNWQPKERTYRINPSYSQVIDYLRGILLNAKYDGEGYNITIDLETNIMSKDKGLTYIRCIGIAISDTDAMCIPINTDKGSRWSTKEEVEIWKLFREICSDKGIVKRVQNQNFELSVLYEWVGEITPIRDAAIAHHLLQPETPKRLQFTNSIYTDIPFYKDDAKEALYADDDTWIYNCKDCVSTHEVLDVCEDELKQLGMYSFYIDYQVPLARELWIAMMTGVKVDVNRVMAYREEYTALLKDAQKELDEFAGREMNVNSPPQMKWLLYTKMGLPVQTKKRKTKDGNKTSETTDEDAINKLSKMFPSKAFDLILNIRGYRKILSTYLKTFWDSDERCRSDFRTWGTVTGRLSSSENIRGTGLNMQNIPSGKDGKTDNIMDIFISDEDCYLVMIDLSQVESRLVAYMSQDPSMMKCFEDGQDIHKLVASMVYGVPYNMLTKESPERQKGKKLGHSANYIVGPGTFGVVAGIPMSSAKLLLNRYYTLFHLGEWHQSVKDHLNKSRVITTPLGRKRTFYDRWGDQLFRDAVAYNPQSTACEHINMAAVRIAPKARERWGDKVRWLLQVHDELVYSVHKSVLDEFIPLVREELSKPIKIHGRDVIIPITIQYGKDWKNARTYEG